MKKTQTALWILQAILAALFLLAGTTKFMMTVEQMTQMNEGAPVPMSGLFLRFIGGCEILGALGLILPAALRIQPVLTPLAACGLLSIMLGATAVTFIGPSPVLAMIPFVVGSLLSLVVYGRRDLLSRSEGS